jgi:hypothetical protein
MNSVSALFGIPKAASYMSVDEDAATSAAPAAASAAATSATSATSATVAANVA